MEKRYTKTGQESTEINPRRSSKRLSLHVPFDRIATSVPDVLLRISTVSLEGVEELSKACHSLMNQGDRLPVWIPSSKKSVHLAKSGPDRSVPFLRRHDPFCVLDLDSENQSELPPELLVRLLD